MAKFIDLTGQKFNRLTVVERVDNEKGNRYKWKCICDCGNTALVVPQNLKNGHTKSCGCLQLEYASENAKKAKEFYREKYLIEGTNISKISKKEPDKLNKSGYKGVHFHNQTQKWEARITFKGKSYYLGRYVNIEDAIKARKTAEEKLFREFLERYEKDLD